MMEEYLTLLGLLVAGHALADYPLQCDFLSQAKSAFASIPRVPWYQALCAQSAIHAGSVGVITGFICLALTEFVIHAFVDHQKCRGNISYNVTQGAHSLCKAIWAGLTPLAALQ